MMLTRPNTNDVVDLAPVIAPQRRRLMQHAAAWPLLIAVSRPHEFSKVKRAARPKLFTKFDDVKSGRIIWTPERRQQLEEMWNCGDSATAIAKVLGCKAAVVSVARARFGLTPRRKISGRPKMPDEPGHKDQAGGIYHLAPHGVLHREELVAQTGHEVRTGGCSSSSKSWSITPWMMPSSGRARRSSRVSVRRAARRFRNPRRANRRRVGTVLTEERESPREG